MPEKKTRTVNDHVTERGVTYEVMADGSKRKLSAKEAASVKPRRPINPSTKQNLEILRKQQAEEQNNSQVKQEMFDANLRAVGLDPDQMRADEQKKSDRREGVFGSVYQAADNLGEKAVGTINNLGERGAEKLNEANEKLQETSEKLKNLGKGVRGIIKRKE
jgi:hypothetical protein